MTQKTITTTFYADASKYNLDSFMDRAILNFENRVVNLYNFAMEENKDLDTKDAKKFLRESMYKVDFYMAFLEAGRFIKLENGFSAKLSYPVYSFCINPKNINFETTLHDIADRISFSPNRLVDNANSSEEITQVKEIKEIPNWRDLFGKGEFPYFTFYTFRLGNTEYFAYSISR